MQKERTAPLKNTPRVRIFANELATELSTIREIAERIAREANEVLDRMGAAGDVPDIPVDDVANNIGMIEANTVVLNTRNQWASGLLQACLEHDHKTQVVPWIVDRPKDE